MIVLTGALAYAVLGCAGDPEDPAARSAPPAEPRAAGVERPSLIAALPDIGRLMWRCDYEDRTSTTLRDDGASLYVSVEADGRRVLTREPMASRSVSTPFAHVRRQTWRIRYSHKPATIRATAKIRFARERFVGCSVSRTAIDVRTRPH